MERIQWLRVGAIAALVLGCIYVLLPTFLAEDISVELATQTSTLETSSKGRTADLLVRFQADGPEPELAKDALVAALAEAAVGTSRIRLEGDRILVTLAPGVARADVVAAASVVDGLTALPAAVDAGPEASQAPSSAGSPPAASSVPPWLVALLPDTRINLGLDLQGGIDLTLQVELEDAILGQVTRDIRALKAFADEDSLPYESMRREHTEPIVVIATDAPLRDVQELLRTRLAGYEYVGSDTGKHRFVMTDVRQKEIADQSVDQVLETLRKRVDATGVKEPSIVKKGGGRINVQLPGLADVQSAVDAIGTTAVLEFRLVDEEFDDAVLEQMLVAAQAAMPEDQYLDDELLNLWLWEQRHLEDDRLILWQYEETPDGPVRSIPIALKSEVVLTGNDVNNANVGRDQNQQPFVSLGFKPRGAKTFCDITSANVQKRFAIILDSQIESAPNIRERICGGTASIEMGQAIDPMKDAQNLALVLRTGALDAPVVVASVRQVGASLGADSIRQGSVAAAAGSLLVLVFMALWYRTAGLIADFALVLNVALVLSCLALFGATLTLPGIAGIALTVGMAVDANIIIYERIREELRHGEALRKAVGEGFDKAVVAVLDANITTAIAGVVLYSYGTGPIKGFAVTLLIGIGTTLVSALFVTRSVVNMATRQSAATLKI